MEKITDKIAALPNDANYFSLEFFPPKTETVSTDPPLRKGKPTDILIGLFEPPHPSGTHV